MKDILKDLKEDVTAKWVDYVLMYIPEVSVMPYDGQVRSVPNSPLVCLFRSFDLLHSAGH